MKLTVVSPTFNEAENVLTLIAQVHEALQGIEHEIIIMDDDSPDLTWKKAQSAAAHDPRVRVVRRVANRGLTPAVIDGFWIARGEYIACIDADLQHDPTVLRRMVEEMDNGADVVVGSRYSTGAGTSNWSKVRKVQSGIATKLSQVVLGLKLHDPLSGYFMLRRSDFRSVHDRLSGNGFKVLLEILGRTQPKLVVEVPIQFRPRQHGYSKLSTKVIMQYAEQLYTLSKPGQYLSVRFTKFAIVGSIGMAVNLIAMAAIIRLFALKDWRASLFASLLATVSNYLLNNSWTFREKRRHGVQFVTGYLIYLAVSLIGITLTAGVYHLLTVAAARMMGISIADMRSEFLLLCQLVAVTAGIYSNYHLNKHGTWGDVFSGSSEPEGAPLELTTKHE